MPAVESPSLDLVDVPPSRTTVAQAVTVNDTTAIYPLRSLTHFPFQHSMPHTKTTDNSSHSRHPSQSEHYLHLPRVQPQYRFSIAEPYRSHSLSDRVQLLVQPQPVFHAVAPP